VAYENTVSDSEYVFTVKEGSPPPPGPGPTPTPTPDPTPGPTPDPMPGPELTDYEKHFRDMVIHNIHPLTPVLKGLLLQIGGNFGTIARETSMAMAGNKKYEPLKNIDTIESKTLLKNQKTIGNDGSIRQQLLPFFEGLDKYLEVLKERNQLNTPADYITVWNQVSKGLRALESVP
jgi:hypothetical protein